MTSGKFYIMLLFLLFPSLAVAQTSTSNTSRKVPWPGQPGSERGAALPVYGQSAIGQPVGAQPARAILSDRNVGQEANPEAAFTPPIIKIPQSETTYEVPEETDSESPSEPEPWTFFQTKNITLGGWSQTGYHTRSTGMFNNHPDQIQQHQTWFFAEKIADGSEGLGLGFRMDYVYGTDGPDTQAFGNSPGIWDIGWDNGNFYGNAIPQLYGEVAMGDVSFKIGHFFTPVGYEAVPATQNFFYSHSYTMYNAEPFTHTGVLGKFNMGDVTSYLGWTAGWDTGFDQFGGSTVLSGAGVQLNESAVLTYIATIGRIGNGTDLAGYSHSLVLDKSLTEKLKYVFQTDLVDFNSSTVFADRRAIGVNQFLIYDLNDKLGLGSRFEWWQTELAPGNTADLLAMTWGVNIKPNLNTRIRPEIRWNRDMNGVLIPAEDNQRLGFGCDLIVTY